MKIKYMKIKLRLLIFFLFAISVNAQIYTPNGTIQGTSANNNVGIGISSPVGKLDISVGSINSFSPTTQIDGSISIGNAASGTFAPYLVGKSSNNVGLFAGALTADANALPDMVFNIRETDNTDYTTLTSTAFRFSRFGTVLIDVLRNGNTTFNGSLFAPTATAGTNNTQVATTAFVLANSISGTGTVNRISKWSSIGSQTKSLLVDQNNDIIYQVATYGSGTIGDESKYIFNTSGTNGAGIAAKKITVNTADLIMYSQYGYNNSTEIARFTSTGRLGIGVTSPSSVLHVVDKNGGFFFDGSSTLYNRIKSTAVVPETPKPLLISAQLSGTTPDIYINTSGNVGVGTMNPTSKLTVAGNINSREVKVTVDAGADFVFENNYNLPSLDSVDKYIKENKHLPEIASADEMKKDGINLSEMNIKLLQKMEEMTLYMIEMKKENEQLKNNQKNLEVRIKKIERR